jgi:hypothetical protein
VRRSKAKQPDHNRAGQRGQQRVTKLIPVRRALGEEAFVVVEGALAPAGIGVVAGGLGQYGSVVNPVLVAGEVDQALVTVHGASA